MEEEIHALSFHVSVVVSKEGADQAGGDVRLSLQIFNTSGPPGSMLLQLKSNK